MKPEDDEQFAKAITTLAVAFGKQAEPAVLEIYWEALKDLDIDPVTRAVAAAIREREFWPPPAVIRELATPLVSDQPEQTPEQRALEAWEFVAKAVRQWGRSYSVEFDDPHVYQAIKANGGWQSLCLRPAAEFTSWARRDFMEAYLAAQSIGSSENKPLAGMHDTTPRKITTGWAGRAVNQLSENTTTDQRAAGLVDGLCAFPEEG